MAASRFVEVTDKEISEIKINSVPKNTKHLCKDTKCGKMFLNQQMHSKRYPCT
jgi:hypothetical protein